VSVKFQTPLNAPAFASQPSTPTLNAGDMYYNTSTGTLNVYTGSVWITLGTTSLAAIDAGTADGIAPYDGGTPVTTATQSYDGGTP
jgi:transcription elongation factor